MANGKKGDPKKKKAAAKKPTPKAGTNVGAQMTQAQKDSFKKRRNIDIRKTSGGNITGRGAPTPKKTTKPRRR